MPTRAKLVVALTLLALLPLAGCSKLLARDELNKGVRAYKAGQFEAAVEHFRKAIEYDPDLLNARLYLATAYANQCTPGAPSEENKQKCDAAIEGFKEVLSRDPKNIIALSYLASIHYEMAKGASGDDAEVRRLSEESKQYRRRLIEVDPQNPEHYYSIGVIDWNLVYLRNQEIRRQLNLQGDRPLPPRERRQFAEENGQLIDEGLNVLLEALKKNPKYLNAIAYANLMYRQKADAAESEAEREEYLRLADEYFQRHQKLREEQMQASPAGQ